MELIHKRRKLSDTDNIRFYLMRSIRRRIARRMNSLAMTFEQYLFSDPEKNIDPPHENDESPFLSRDIARRITRKEYREVVDCARDSGLTNLEIQGSHFLM